MIQQNWKQLASIQIGGVICLPMVLIGHTLSQTYGWASACSAIVLGNLGLLGLALLIFQMSYPSRLSTVEQAKAYFGPAGTKLFALAMVVSMTGWFAIQLNVMSMGLMDLINGDATVWSNLIFGCLITWMALFGIRAINWLANLSLPLLIFTLAYACWASPDKEPNSPMPYSLGGISLVLAAAIAAVIDIPTYFRHARTVNHGRLGLLFTFGLALPLIEIVGAYLASQGSEGLLLASLKNSFNPLWNGWIALFLILAGWTTNNTNLYSAAISLKTLIPSWDETKRIMAIGLIGTVLSTADLLHHLELTLSVLGLMVASISAVMLACFLVNSPLSSHRRHLAASIVGIAIGAASLGEWVFFTSFPILDAFLAAGIVTILLLAKRMQNEKACP